MNSRGLKHIVLAWVILLNCKGSHANAFMDDVGDAIHGLGNLLHTIGSKVENVVDGIKILENVITEAIEENCEFRCANGAKPAPNPFHEPTPNGCGSMGLKWKKESLPLEQLTRCCNRHDICYDTCNKDKEDCDKKFKSCLYKICDIYKEFIDGMLHKKCKAAAKLMFTGTTALGCKSYKDAQAKACLCKKKKHEDL